MTCRHCLGTATLHDAASLIGKHAINTFVLLLRNVRAVRPREGDVGWEMNDPANP